MAKLPDYNQTLALRTDPAAVMRATGLLRSFMDADYAHVNAVLEATLQDPDEHALMATFAAMVGLAATAIAGLALADVYPDIDQTLGAVARQLIAGDVPPPTGTTKDT